MMLHQIPIEIPNNAHCSGGIGFLGTASNYVCNAPEGCINETKEHNGYHHVCFRQGAQTREVKYCECNRRKGETLSYYIYGQMMGYLCQDCRAGKCRNA